jgi:hypothetical protein
MCRAPVVLVANRCKYSTFFGAIKRLLMRRHQANVDWALMNFMQDWFPVESSIKSKQNEQEAAQEQMDEFGLSDRGCITA